GVTDSPRSLRIFADQLSETAQVTDAGRLTYAGVAAEPKLAPLRRVSVGFSLTDACGRRWAWCQCEWSPSLSRLRSDPALSLPGDRPGILIVYAMPGDGVWLSGRPGGPA